MAQRRRRINRRRSNDALIEEDVTIFVLSLKMVNQFGAIAGGSGGGGGGISGAQITLSNMDWVNISDKTFGTFHVQLSSDVAGGPSLVCDITKLSAADAYIMGNVLATPAADGCKIGIAWDNGAFLRVSKSMVTFNGVYNLYVFGP